MQHTVLLYTQSDENIQWRGKRVMNERLKQLLDKWKNDHTKWLKEHEVDIASGVKDCIDDLENLLNGGDLHD